MARELLTRTCKEEAMPLSVITEGNFQTPNVREFYSLIQGLTLSAYLKQTQTLVDLQTVSLSEKEQIQLHMRDHLVQQIKQLAVSKGFRVKQPYADRIDRQGTRTINFYCHMSKSANRKLSLENQQGCGFRVMYKLRSPGFMQAADEIF